MPTGKVKWYDAEKGFGFLSKDDGRRRLRARRRPARRHPDAQGRHPGGVRARPGTQGRPGPPGAAARPGRLGRQVGLEGPAQEAGRHGQHHRGPLPAARGRRAGPTAPAGTPTPRPPSRPPRCCARSPTSSSSEPGSLSRPPGPGLPRGAAGPPVTRAPRRSRRPGAPAATPSPSLRDEGSAMPMKPPTTQDSWSSVSERANVPARCRSGTSRWISASSDSLPSDWASAGGEAEQRRRWAARRTAATTTATAASASSATTTVTCGRDPAQHRAEPDADGAAEAGRADHQRRAAASGVSSQPGNGSVAQQERHEHRQEAADSSRSPALQRSATTTPRGTPGRCGRAAQRATGGSPRRRLSTRAGSRIARIVAPTKTRNA